MPESRDLDIEARSVPEVIFGIDVSDKLVRIN